MINNQLLDEIIYYSLKDEYISKELIEKIVEYAISQTDEYTKNKFNNLIFESIEWKGKAVCTCELTLGNIRVDYDKLIYQYKHSKTLTHLASNLDMIGELFHEINHLREESKMKTLNLESLLLSYSSFEIFDLLVEDKLKLIKKILTESLYDKKFIKAREELYLSIYEKVPSERFASINALKEVFSGICNYDNFQNKYSDAFEFINNAYLCKYYMGYEKIRKNSNCFNSPLLDYLNFIKMPDLLSCYDFFSTDINELLKKSSKEFTIEERMFYGFPVTLEETDELDKKLILTK